MEGKGEWTDLPSPNDCSAERAPKSGSTLMIGLAELMVQDLKGFDSSTRAHPCLAAVVHGDAGLLAAALREHSTKAVFAALSTVTCCDSSSPENLVRIGELSPVLGPRSESSQQAAICELWLPNRARSTPITGGASSQASS